MSKASEPSVRDSVRIDGVPWSADGLWWWDGTQWRPALAPAAFGATRGEPSSVAVPAYKSIKRAGSVETALLLLFVLIQAVLIGELAQDLSYGIQIQNDTLTVPATYVIDTDNWVSVFASISFSWLLLTGIGYLAWAYRAYSNLSALGVRQLQRKPKWIILGNIIPIANIFIPYRMMRETWVGSDPGTKEMFLAHRERAKTWWLLYLWWACWIVGNLVSRTYIYVGAPNNLARAIWIRQWEIAGESILTLSAVFLVFVIRSVGNRQSNKIVKLSHASTPAN